MLEPIGALNDEQAAAVMELWTRLWCSRSLRKILLQDRKHMSKQWLRSLLLVGSYPESNCPKSATNLPTANCRRRILVMGW